MIKYIIFTIIFQYFHHLSIQIQINGLETRPNSLAGSLVKVSTAIEWNVCKRVVNLGQESSVDLLSVSLALDSLLATANHELEDLYVKIGQVLEQIVKDKKLSKEWRRLNLDALQALISVANGLDDRLASELDGLDASESSIIDQQIGSLIAVNGLDCECACPIPKRSISVVEQTAKELKNCVAEEEDSIKWALENACKNLQDIVNKTVRKVWSQYNWHLILI